MSVDIKIWGYSENKETKLQFDHKQTKKCLVASTSGKSVFDFMYFEEKYILGVFRDISDSIFYNQIEDAQGMVSYHCAYNVCLAAYVIEFLEYLTDGTDEALSELTAFMGSGFIAPPIDSPDYRNEFLKCMVKSVLQKQTELKSLVKSVLKAEGGTIKERFIRQGKTNKLADFNFNCFLSPEISPLKFPLKTADDVMRFDLMQMFVKELEFKPCKYCGRYFVPLGRTDCEYCDRIMIGETKPCSEIGALKTFDIVHKDDPIHKAYITAYRRMDSRQRAKLITKEEFKEFGKNARAERKKCYNGEITLEQFQTWLDDFR